MREVHFDRPSGGGTFLPICGDWGSPDSDWTREPRGVTCQACLAAMARVAVDGPVAVSLPPRSS